MNNFYSYNPTKILFGKGMIARIGAELRDVSKILLVYGGGSIKRNGVYDQVRSALKDWKVVEFGGVEPNPEYETCVSAIKFSRAEGVDFVLAAGGGSTIDAAKFIALAYAADIEDSWRIVTGEAAVPAKVLPVGCIQTLPASGAEINNALVLSRRSIRRKLSFNTIALYPRFSVLDPEATMTLSRHQTALGMADIFMHVLEQYMTYPAGALLQDRQSEAILSTLVEVAQPLLERLDDYDLRATVAWCAAQTSNGTINRGVPTDWATHAIGHELTALYDIPHAQTLVLVVGGMYLHQIERKKAKLAQYGRRVWGLSGSDGEVARAAIDCTVAFFDAMGLPTRFSALGMDIAEVAPAVRRQFEQSGFQPIGEHKDIDLNAIDSILALCA
jgi:NADP-dependent alcohol dehydrogenase